MSLVISEIEFRQRVEQRLKSFDTRGFGAVTGPGRSGAIAAVYASHLLGLQFIPFGSKPPFVERFLIVDTAAKTGKTIRKSLKLYHRHDPQHVVFFDEPPRVKFWYETLER